VLALFGNASGGVISIWTDPDRSAERPPGCPHSCSAHSTAILNRNWSKWQSSTSFRVGAGSGSSTVSRLDYTGTAAALGRPEFFIFSFLFLFPFFFFFFFFLIIFFFF